MDIYANIPPLFEPGQDLYAYLIPADAMELCGAALSDEVRYNPGVMRAVGLLNRAVHILRGFYDYNAPAQAD
jgi:hypothetical protein